MNRRQKRIYYRIRSFFLYSRNCNQLYISIFFLCLYFLALPVINNYFISKLCHPGRQFFYYNFYSAFSAWYSFMTYHCNPHIKIFPFNYFLVPYTNSSIFLLQMIYHIPVLLAVFEFLYFHFFSSS